MKLSSNTRYAIRILFELEGLKEPVSTALLAEKTGMSPRTVENIHAVLRQAKITSGTVGAKGGIQLLTPLAGVSLGRLVGLFDGGVEFAVCCGEKSNECPNQYHCEIRNVWGRVSRTVQEQLDAISLGEIKRQYSHGYPHGNSPTGEELFTAIVPRAPY